MKRIINNSTLWLLLCIALVVLSQILILQPILNFSQFTEDDWLWMLNFRFLADFSFLEKLVFIWTKIGIHEGGYAAYIGILGTIFGNNYSLYQYVNIIFKIIATLTLFPLILILFKKRFLALLTTVIYGINSASTGSFYWYMKGGIFPAIALMNLFFISYYFTLIKHSRILLLLSSALALLSYLISPTRIFPIFLIVIGVEIYWCLRHKSKTAFGNSLVRVISLLLPSILISLLAPISPRGRVESTPLTLLNQVLAGNWFNFLTPLEGLGFSLFTNENMKMIFGHIVFLTFKNLNNYLVFLFQGTVVLLFSLILLAILISKKPLRFIIEAFTLNIVMDVIMFFVATNHFLIPKNQVQEIDPSLFVITKPPTLVAIFILVLAFMAFLEWLKDKKTLLIAIFIGPIFSLIFLASMWVTLGYLLDGYNSIHYYYQIPAIGISLFLASILVLFYERFKNYSLRGMALVFIAGIIFVFYLSSSAAVNREFLGIYSAKVEVKDQQILHDKLIKKLGSFDKEGNILVYFEFPKGEASNNYYKAAFSLDNSSFGSMVYWWKERSKPSCVGNISNIDSLQSKVIFQKEKWGFVLNGRCIQKLPQKGVSVNEQYWKESVFYSVDSLYAFKVDKGEFIDIKDKVLQKLKIPGQY